MFTPRKSKGTFFERGPLMRCGAIVTEREGFVAGGLRGELTVNGYQVEGIYSNRRMAEEANGYAARLSRNMGDQLSNNSETSEKPASSAKDQWLNWCEATHAATITMQANRKIWQVVMGTLRLLLEAGHQKVAVC
jgi:hypothetical protein